MASAAAQETFPARAVRLVVPFAPGGDIDTVARLIAPKMSASFGQPVIVENRPGAGGTIAAGAVAKSPPDGHTVLFSSNSLAVAPSLYQKLPFDVVSDFAPVTQLFSSASALVVTPKLSAATVKELVAAAKAKPRGLNYGHTGVGAPSHLTMELLKILAGIDMVAIPYQGMAPLGAALISGEIDVAIAPVAFIQGHVRANRVRLLAVTSGKRVAVLPDAPTVAEGGFPGFEASGWLSFFVAANTPVQAVRHLHRTAADSVAAEEVRDKLPALGLEVVMSTPEEFAQKFRADIAQFARVVRETGIQAK